MPFRAKDVMSKKVKSITPDMNARQALKALLRSGRSGLPVIDRRGRLCGVFTEKEILKAILPGYITKVGSFIYGEDSKSELKKLARLGRFKVRDLMRKEAPVLNEETSLTEISHVMLTRNERRIIITRGSKVVGIVTRCDVVKALSDEAGLPL
ncbi:MAG: CBS domain-containing protein [Candidatus Omnitrophota bacterium]